MRRRDFLKGLAAVCGVGLVPVADELQELPAGLISPIVTEFDFTDYPWFSYQPFLTNL